MSSVRYDDSLPLLVEALSEEFEPATLAASVVLRDASGRLAAFVDRLLDEAKVDRLSRILRERLGAYARLDRTIAGTEAAGTARILSDPGVRHVLVGSHECRYLDRRVVGADWLREPSPVQSKPPRFVFASLKGGVGRTTALSVLAAEQARRGRNVLVVDLDLEAPGIGSLLLSKDREPRYGVLDYLVELNLGPLSTKDSDDFIGTSSLTSGSGLVDVAPVVGLSSDDSPENYLSKLSLAMTEGIADLADPLSVVDKIVRMVSALEARRSYDIVLIDARAGLAELAAGPLLSLGAHVLFFGTSQPQTTQGLRFLFAHLRGLVERGKESPWQMLKIVHAKAQQLESHQRFKDELWELFSEFLYEEQEGLVGFNFDADEPDAPHNPIPIPLDVAFADWDPVEKPGKLVEAYYLRTFGPLVDFVDDVLAREPA